MAVLAKTLYGTDFAEWSAQTAELLRQRRFDEIDIENVAEEIQSLGDSQFQGARSQLGRMLWDLINRKLKPERDGGTWRASIVNAQQEILDAIDSSPSLRRRLTDRFDQTYRQAIKGARYETGLDAVEIPAECPFVLEQLLEGDPTLLHF
ncbi:MAG: DUF29 domain-containing protein [Bryobacteraceae bacterium]|jgi:Domain of unknown function DUF29